MPARFFHLCYFNHYTKDLPVPAFVLCTCRMFRTLLRSAPDPIIREHVCFSCLAAGGRAQARLFSRPSLLRSDLAEKQSSQSNEKKSRGKGRPSKHTRDVLSRSDSAETQSSQSNEKSSRGKGRPNKHTRDDLKSKTRRSRRTRAASKGKTHSRSKATSAKSIEDTFMTLSEVGLFGPRSDPAVYPEANSYLFRRNRL
jgi:hypothetical protein